MTNKQNDKKTFENVEKRQKNPIIQKQLKIFKKNKKCA